MAHPKRDEPEIDLPAGLSKPALRALSAAGYTRLDQFTAITEADLRKLHGVGPTAIELIRKALNARRQAKAGRDIPLVIVEPD